MIKTPKFKFESLHIWQDAMTLGEDINSIAISFPKKEQYNLSSQICRAWDSVVLNISEGSIIQSKPEFRRFLGYSARSLAEVITCLHKAHYRSYITSEKFDELYIYCFKLMNMIIAFRNKL